jgi:hypothetical protein
MSTSAPSFINRWTSRAESGWLDVMRTTTIPRPVVTEHDEDEIPYLEATAPGLVAELLDLCDRLDDED